MSKKKIAGFIFVVMVALATFAIAEAQHPSDWEGPTLVHPVLDGYTWLDKSDPKDDTYPNFSVLVDPGDVVLLARDNDPKWVSCDPELRQTGASFYVGSEEHVVPVSESECPEDPPDGEWFYKTIHITEPITITFQKGDDSAYGEVWWYSEPTAVEVSSVSASSEPISWPFALVMMCIMLSMTAIVIVFIYLSYKHYRR